MPPPSPQSDEKADEKAMAQPAPQPVRPYPRTGPLPLPMPLSRFNAASADGAAAVLLRCCACTRWADRVAACRPYPDTQALLAALDEASYDLTPRDLAEALASESPQVPSPGDGGTQAAAAGEARGVLAAHTALRAAHAAYENRFGHAFLICLDECAPGEQLGHALASVRTRLGNDLEEEHLVVTEELRRLARGRLLRMVGGEARSR